MAMASGAMPQRAATVRRPVWGAILAMVAGVVIGWMPVHLLVEAWHLVDPVAWLGLGWAVLVLGCGILALTDPARASLYGVLIILGSIGAIFGAFGGLLVGSLLGIVGGSLCVAWEPRGRVAPDDGPPPGGAPGDGGGPPARPS